METTTLDRFSGNFARFTTYFRARRGLPLTLAAATFDGPRVNLRARNPHDTATADRPGPPAKTL